MSSEGLERESLANTLILQSEDNKGVVTLTLNNSANYNALSRAMLTKLHVVLLALNNHKNCRVIVIEGGGKGFCAGHDLKELLTIKADSSTLFELCSQVMLAVENHRCPVIAKVRGAAFAAGCQLVASCDLAIATEQAIFSTPGVNIGLFCSTPMVPLSRSVAKKHALEMLLTGEAINAQKAVEIGLINTVVAADKLTDAVNELAAKIAAKSAATLKVGKAGFYHQLPLTSAEAYSYTAQVMSDNLHSNDANEGISAFLAKRPPVWQDD